MAQAATLPPYNGRKISELEKMKVGTEQATYSSATAVRTFPKPAENAVFILVLTLSILL
jgi:hypothetical protein